MRLAQPSWPVNPRGLPVYASPAAGISKHAYHRQLFKVSSGDQTRVFLLMQQAFQQLSHLSSLLQLLLNINLASSNQSTLPRIPNVQKKLRLKLQSHTRVYEKFLRLVVRYNDATSLMKISNQAWLCVLVISVLKKQRQGCQNKFETNYIVSSKETQ